MAPNDKIGDYTLKQLLGAAPVSSPPVKKKGPLAKIVAAPFKLIAALVKAPITLVSRVVGGIANAVAEVVKLPVRLLGALARPWRKK